MTELDMDGAIHSQQRIAIVTGANVGIGFETTKGLVKEGFAVVMACRSLERGQAAKKTILREVPTAKLTVTFLDLASFDSIREFANSMTSSVEKIDVLVNNAGIMIPEFELTDDNLESQMGVNYFGHFLLTNLLMPLLNKQPGSRVVSVSSIAHEKGRIDFDNLNSEHSYDKFHAYRQSKLACLMFAYELQRHLDLAGGSVVSVAAHPGVSNTQISRNIPRWLYHILLPLVSGFLHSPKKGAESILMAALDPSVKGGDYFGPSGFRGMKGFPVKIEPKRHALDKAVSEQLWEESELITGEIFNV